MFENLTLGDFETEPSTDEEGNAKPTIPEERFDFEEWAETQEVRQRSEPALNMEATRSTIEQWRTGLTDEGRTRSVYQSYPRTQGYRGRHRPMGRRTTEQRNAQIMTSEVPVRQADGTPQHHRIQVSALVSGGEGKDDPASPNTVRESTLGYQPSRVEGSAKKIEKRLALVDFRNLTKINRPGWREFGRKSDPEITKQEMDVCTCYGFDQECWASTEERWVPHIQHCEKCRKWNDQRCILTGHTPKSKTSVLADLGNRRYIADYPIKDEHSVTCCQRRVCTHEFYEHQEVDIPWWACVEENCEEHQEAKIRNQRWPQLPRSAILKAQECPCFRNGCLCNFSERHTYKKELLVPPGKTEVLRNLEETKRVWQSIKEESEQTLAKLRENITNLHMVSTEDDEQVPQIDIKVKVGETTIAAVVDCGADVDYVNEDWCRQKGFPITESGEGIMRSFNGKQTRAKVRKTEIKFRYEGVFIR